MDHLSAMADLAVSGASPGADVSRGRFIDGSLHELAVSLARGNDLVVRRFHGLQARLTGGHFRPGVAVPTADGAQG
jgi:hypothetical protein